MAKETTVTRGLSIALSFILILSTNASVMASPSDFRIANLLGDSKTTSYDAVDEDYTKNIGLGIVPKHLKASEYDKYLAIQDGRRFKEENKNRDVKVMVDGSDQNRSIISLFSASHEEMTGFTNYKQYNYNDLMTYETLKDGRPGTIANIGCLLT